MVFGYGYQEGIGGYQKNILYGPTIRISNTDICRVKLSAEVCAYMEQGFTTVLFCCCLRPPIKEIEVGTISFPRV
jgi:hypothetical protein